MKSDLVPGKYVKYVTSGIVCGGFTVRDAIRFRNAVEGDRILSEHHSPRFFAEGFMAAIDLMVSHRIQTFDPVMTVVKAFDEAYGTDLIDQYKNPYDPGKAE